MLITYEHDHSQVIWRALEPGYKIVVIPGDYANINYMYTAPGVGDLATDPPPPSGALHLVYGTWTLPPSGAPHLAHESTSNPHLHWINTIESLPSVSFHKMY